MLVSLQNLEKALLSVAVCATEQIEILATEGLKYVIIKSKAKSRLLKIREGVLKCGVLL